MASVWYWALFALAAVIVVAVPVVAAWEERQDERDRELWAEMPGATRP